MTGVIRILLAAPLACAALSCAAATKVWLGTYGQTSYWSNGANWKDGAPPVNGDRLLFDVSMVWWDSSNDLNGLVLDGMDFNGFNMSIKGNPVTLTNPSAINLVGSGTPLFFLPITLAAPDSTVTAVAGTGPGPPGTATLDFPGGLVLNGGTFSIHSGTYVWFDGPVSELTPTSISIDAPNFQVTKETIAITGTLAVHGGYFLGNEMPGMAGALIETGSYAMESRTGSFATPLDLRLTGANPQFFFGGEIPTSPAVYPLDVTAPISLTGLHYFIPDTDTTFDGPISGNGQVVLSTNSHSVTFSNAGNSYTGGTEIQGGSNLHFVNTGSLAPKGALSIDSGGRADLGRYSQSVNGFKCMGTFEITAGASLTSTGPVDITDCALQLDVPAGYIAPATIMLVANTSGSPVVGEFAGMPEGSSVNVGSAQRTITYNGEAGHNIALTTPSAPHIQFDQPNYVVLSGQTFSLVATYTGADGHGVAGVQLTVGFVCYSAGACLTLQGPMTVATDSRGKAAFQVTAGGAGTVGVSLTDSSNNVRANAVVTIGAPTGSMPAVQDMWWNPSENGWGMSLIQHNDTLFGALYVYDTSGKPMWVVMPGGSWDSTHGTYTAALYQPTGSPFFAYNAQTLQVGASIGNVSIAFQDANNATLDYTIGSVTGHKFVTREIFANGSAVAPVRSDLWWGGAAQTGWGITVLQQASTLFAIWYTYDANGHPFWYVMPGGAWTSSDIYEGTLYRTTGSPWVGKSYDPSKLQVTNAGTYKFQFNGDTATFEYSADGHSGSVPLVREPF